MTAIVIYGCLSSKITAESTSLCLKTLKNDILFMFLSHLVAKIWAELDFQNSMTAILDFVNFKHVPGNRKNDNIFFLHLAYILKLNKVKTQF